MPPFKKPDVVFTCSVPTEKTALRKHRLTREIPAKKKDHALVATWNIANLGAQDRTNDDFALIAEILNWFDIIAVQEVRENFADLANIVQLMGKNYTYVMSDASGNDERMAFIFDRKKFTLAEEIGEIAFPPTEYKNVKVTGATATFNGFDRTPYFATFLAEHFSLLLANVHLYYGSEARADIERRALETAAVARWARLRAASKYATTRDLFALGDFNMPKGTAGTLVFSAATSGGLQRPLHSTEVPSAIASDNSYDQILYFPEQTEKRLVAMGVYDYDTVIFRKLWTDILNSNQKAFQEYLRYYISDHRPLWCQINMAPMP